MTFDEFRKKWGTKTPWLLVHTAFNPIYPEETRKECEQSVREMTIDLTSALEHALAEEKANQKG